MTKLKGRKCKYLLLIFKDWIKQGRLGSPRVLFLFLSAPISLRGTRGFRYR